MINKITLLIKERDEKLIKKYCQEGTFLDEKGQIIHGVCKNVSLSELLNDIHVHDALIVQALKGEA